jgi:hypothetical protein
VPRVAHGGDQLPNDVLGDAAHQLVVERRPSLAGFAASGGVERAQLGAHVREPLCEPARRQHVDRRPADRPALEAGQRLVAEADLEAARSARPHHERARHLGRPRPSPGQDT